MLQTSPQNSVSEAVPESPSKMKKWAPSPIPMH